MSGGGWAYVGQVLDLVMPTFVSWAVATSCVVGVPVLGGAAEVALLQVAAGQRGAPASGNQANGGSVTVGPSEMRPAKGAAWRRVVSHAAQGVRLIEVSPGRLLVPAGDDRRAASVGSLFLERRGER